MSTKLTNPGDASNKGAPTKRWVTLFERYEDFHYRKDVGQMPASAGKFLNYQPELWRVGAAATVTTPPDFTVRSIPGVARPGFTPQVAKQIWQEAKAIDVLNLFHLRPYSIVYGWLYKKRNPRGKVLLKGDFSSWDNLDQGFWSDSKNPFKNAYRRALRRMAQSIDLVLSEHRAVAARLNQKGLISMPFPNGVSRELLELSEGAADRKDGDTAHIIFVGPVGDIRKNAEQALQALVRLPLTLSWHAHFVGKTEDGYRQRLTELKGRHPEHFKRISIHGYVSKAADLAAILSKGDIFLMTSLSEGYPLSLVEAGAFACMPLISERSGGQDLIESSRSGHIFHSDAQLTEMLDAAVRDIEQTRANGILARRHILVENDWAKKFPEIEDKLSQQ